ncbi:glycosyltransferase family 2 protein [Photobacterium lutimaris]|uniref:Glycosyl transferase n=1 Tax=Photobacterium lutimaris TaxID=388278 RepID=A0A2T3IX99_9GAMM|nr:glycosyltransferase family 2 protein [Photobacterium lutimaris]PSU33168.1 glycosyl transferase [Photobacterium lutimaris]TDR75256.1 glycosyltransferase involved in cell wall biosynthesis [Photobacterium lutimaris]
MISVLIITYNESLHIERCLESVKCISDDIVIVDSYSTDNTEGLAIKNGVRFYKNSWVNHSNQINWAIDNIDFKNDFIFRIDADEYLTPELVAEIKEVFSNQVDKKINGFNIKRRTYFLGRWMKHGGYYPTVLLRIWRKGKARCEDREMDEHMVLTDGDSTFLKFDFIDHNLMGINSWIDKHNRYSEKEVIEYYKSLSGRVESYELGEAKKNRLLKNKYYKLPLFLRSFLMFIYRYLLRLGFLDGKEGLMFYVLQTFWYRFLVDSKIYEKENDVNV